MEKELEQTLQVEIMEPYLFTAEMRYRAIDQESNMKEMQGHWEALKSFITKVQAEAYQAGIRRGIEVVNDCGFCSPCGEHYNADAILDAELHGNK